MTPPTPAALLRVLVVDDHRDHADSLASVLHAWGFEAAAVYDGRAAVATYSSYHPAVCLLDWDTPGMDGLDLGRRLRALAGARPLVLLAVTGHAHGDEALRGRLLAGGFDHVYKKPVDLAQLRPALRLLGKSLAVVAQAGSAHAARSQELLNLTLEFVRQGRKEVSKAKALLGALKPKPPDR